MSYSLVRRNGNVFKVSTAGNLQPGASYKVTAYAPGAVVSVASAGASTTATVYAGHGFPNVATNYMMVGTTPAKFTKVMGSGATTLTLNTPVQTYVGDVILNLGTDTATGGAPQYDGSTVVIYSDPDTVTPTAITTPAKSQVTSDAEGDYGYWIATSTNAWELVRDSAGTPQAYNIQTAIAFPLTSSDGTTTDNAIVRWDGTDGTAIQDGYSGTAPTIADNGNISAPGTHSLGPTAITGAFSATGVATVAGVTSSAIVKPSADSTIDLGVNTTNRWRDAWIGRDLSVTRNVAVTGTLAVTGVTTLVNDLVTTRVKATGGTALTVTDFTAFTGWGTSAPTQATAVTGNDTRFTVTVTANASPAANATFVFTFKDGTYTNPPFAIVTMSGGTGAMGLTKVATTSTNLTITYVPLPVSGGTYIFTVLVLG